MKKLIAFFCLTLASTFLFAYDVPKATNYVNDYGNLLSVQEQNQLNQFLKTYQDSTSNQIAVLTLINYDDQKDGPLFDYSMQVFRTWKIGQKSKNNGVLLVVVKNLASKNAPGLRIVTGYGLEGPLPDAICRRIIENIRPLVNEGKYYQGINTGITSMIVQIKGEFTNDSKSDDISWGLIIIIIIIVIVIIFIIVISWGGPYSSGGGFIYSSDSSSSSSSGGSFGDFGGGDGGGSGGGD